MNNLQLILILIAIVIHLCNGVDFDGNDFGVSHLKSVVWNVSDHNTAWCIVYVAA